MAYDPHVVEAARERLEKRRRDAVNEATALRDEMCLRLPRLAAIEQELATALPELTGVILSGGTAEDIARIKEHNLRLQNERALLLRENGVERDNFEPLYTCPVCKDTGYADGRMCDCYRRLLQEEACRRLSAVSSLRLTDFDALDPAYYDPSPDPKLGTSQRQRMLDIIAYCRDYAAAFDRTADSLLLQGATGTGKTHLSLAIAKKVVEQGYSVVYGSVQPLLKRLEDEHFGRADGDSEAQLLACDLLVLDDLGMEFDSPFYRVCLYNILNTRLLDGRATIISTNLSLAAIRDRYGDQIASRITGGFEKLFCVGQDIRQLRRRPMR